MLESCDYPVVVDGRVSIMDIHLFEFLNVEDCTIETNTRQPPHLATDILAADCLTQVNVQVTS